MRWLSFVDITKLNLQEPPALTMKDITDKGHQPDPVDRDDDLHGNEDPEVGPDEAEGLSDPVDGKLPEGEDNPDELIPVKVNGDVVEMTREEAIAGDGPNDTDGPLASVLPINSRVKRNGKSLEVLNCLKLAQ
jgi:hypothetical protein